MEVIVDRFEGEYAILEIDKDNLVEVPRILVLDAKEGDVVSIVVLKEKTEERKDKISKLMDNLFED